MDGELVESLAARFGRSHAVLIGVDDYRGGIPPLRNAVRDALQLGHLLGTEHGFTVSAFFNERATRDEVLGYLRETLPKQLGSRDRVILYAATHGHSLPSDAGPDGFVLLHDAERGEPATFLAMEEIYRALHDLPCPHGLVILDCCFAGAFRWATTRDVASRRVFRETFDRFVTSPAWQALTSAAADQLAFDAFSGRSGAEQQHSPFSIALQAALRGAADHNGDGLVTATDLYQYIRDELERAIARPSQRQTPGLFPLPRHDHGEFVFAVPGRRLQLTSAEELTEGRNPYAGLDSYDERRADGLFGREAAIQALQDLVDRQQLVVVTGPSGTGKSSLVQAGLVPSLRRLGWSILAPRRPGLSPRATLAGLAGELASAETSPHPTLVVIDQLEELATLSRDPAEAKHFLEGLAAALRRSSHLHLVVTVRADLEARFELVELWPRWREGRFVVPAMTAVELRAVIEGPAHQLGMYFDPPAIIDRLLEDALTAPVPLPLLSFALHEMYRARLERRLVDRAFRAEDLASVGSVRNALARRATAVSSELAADPACGATLRNVMLRMVTPIGTELARRRVLREELSFGDADEDARVTRVLEALHGARLLSLGTETASGTSPGLPYAEPAHDELVRGWQQLTSWWQANLPHRGVLEAVSSAARTWQAQTRRTAYLWTHDPRLAQVVKLAEGAEPALNLLERDFVHASAKQHVRRRRRLILVVTAVIAALSIAAFVAMGQRDRARHNFAESQRVLSLSLTEQGRRFLVEGRPRHALPFLARARELGADSPPLRLLFAQASRHLWTIEARHAGGLSMATFSADGRWFATASFDGTARVWDAATGAAASSPLAHGTQVQGVHFSPDGQRLVTTGLDARARIWRWHDGTPIAELSHRERVRTAVTSPDGRWIVTASQDDTAQLWDASNGAPVGAPLKHEGDVTSAAFSPDSTEVATSSDDGTVRIWSTAKALPRGRALPHGRAVIIVQWSPVDDHLLTVDDNATIRIWNPTTAELETSIAKNQTLIQDAQFSPDAAHLLTASNEGWAELWDVAKGKDAGPAMSHRDLVLSAAFSPDGKRIATGSYDATARIWDATTGAPLTPPLEHDGAVESVEMSPDGAFLLTASADGAARIWPVIAGIPLSMTGVDASVPIAAELSTDGALMLAAAGKTARVWHAATGLPATPPLPHDAPLETASFDAETRGVLAVTNTALHRWKIATGALDWKRELEGRVVAAQLDSSRRRLVVAESDGAVTVHDTQNGRAFLRLSLDAKAQSAAISPDGMELATASAHSLQRWSTSTPAAVGPLRRHDDTLQLVRYAASGERLVAIDGDELVIWSRSGEKEASFLHRQQVCSAELDGAERRVVSASWDDTARIWELSTKRALGLPLQHDHDVEDARWSRDGAMVITSSRDRSARIWDAATGQPLTPPLEHSDGVRLARFSPDGQRVLTASYDGIAHLWELPHDSRSAAQWRAIAERYARGAAPGLPEPGRDAKDLPLLTSPTFTAAQQRIRAANLLASGQRLGLAQPALAIALVRAALELSQRLGDEDAEAQAQAFLAKIVEAPPR